MNPPSIFSRLIMPSLAVGVLAGSALVAAGHPWLALVFVPGTIVAAILVRRMW